MDLLDIPLKEVQAEWAIVTAHPGAFMATLAIGLIFGWGTAWLFWHQRLALHKERIEHYKSMINEGAPSFGVRHRESGLGTFGTILAIGGLIALVVGIVFIFISRIQSDSGQLSLPLSAPSEQRQRVPTVDPVEPPKATIVQSAPPLVMEAPVLQSPSEPIPEAKIVPPPAPNPRPPTPPVEPRRIFVDSHVTPQFLVGLYEGNTALRARTLVSEQIGKWMPVSGPLGEIHPGPVFLGEKIDTMVVFSFSQKPQVYMWFSSREWTDRLALLAKNQHISVIGQIKKIEPDQVVLEKCELVDSDPPTKAPKRSPNSPARQRRRRRSSQG
jgi:hypothetical protein